MFVVPRVGHVVAQVIQENLRRTNRLTLRRKKGRCSFHIWEVAKITAAAGVVISVLVCV